MVQQKQYFGMAMFGFMLAMLGSLFIITGVGISSLYLIGFIPDSFHLGILGVAVGIVMLYFGWKFIWENESPITKLLLFICGLYFVVFGIILIIGGATTIGAVIPIIIGITFIDRVVGTRIWERVKRII